MYTKEEQNNVSTNQQSKLPENNRNTLNTVLAKHQYWLVNNKGWNVCRSSILGKQANLQAGSFLMHAFRDCTSHKTYVCGQFSHACLTERASKGKNTSLSNNLEIPT